MMTGNIRGKVWFDFENAPQVLVLRPLIQRFREAGFETVHTARRFSMTVELCRRHGLQVHVLGSGSSSSSRIVKTLRVLQRAFLLSRLPELRRDRPVLGISHASRSQLLSGRLMGIPVVILDDYEHSDQTLAGLAREILVPYPIPADAWGRRSGLVTHYPGLKENLYLSGFIPSGEVPGRLEEAGDRIRVILRPEGRTAHYRSEDSARLQDEVVLHLSGMADVIVIVFPRDRIQENEIRAGFRGTAADVWFPGVLDGPDLITQCDMVVGGGGTMTRDAAVLGVPSYSFFSGKWGSVDRRLEDEGRLHRIGGVEDVRALRPVRRTRGEISVSSEALEFVSEHLIGMADELAAGGPGG